MQTIKRLQLPSAHLFHHKSSTPHCCPNGLTLYQFISFDGPRDSCHLNCAGSCYLLSLIPLLHPARKAGGMY